MRMTRNQSGPHSIAPNKLLDILRHSNKPRLLQSLSRMEENTLTLMVKLPEFVVDCSIVSSNTLFIVRTTRPANRPE